MYYLRSRYYVVAWCRFLNADVLLNRNTFSYCNNAPISLRDDNGFFPSSKIFTVCAIEGSGPSNLSKAVSYALTNWNQRNQDYYDYGSGGDCTNFTSQCLVEAGFNMDDEWHSNKRERQWHAFLSEAINYKYAYSWDVTKAWRSAPDQYSYLKNAGYTEGEIICYSTSNLTMLLEPCSHNGLAPRSIMPGDLMYFDWSGDGQIDHSSIITEIDGNEIYLTYHSTDRKNKPLSAIMQGYPQMIGYIVLIDY